MQVSPHELRRRRELAGLTVNGLARLAGVDQANLRLIEAGRRGATQQTVERLADALGIDPLDLYTDEAAAVSR